MLQVNYDSIGKQKFIGIFCMFIAIIPALISIVCFLGYEEGIGTFFGVVCLVLVGVGYSKIKLSKSVTQYVNLINSGFLDIEEISQKLNKEKSEIIEELEELIKNGIFLNVFYDKENKKIVEIISKQSSNIEKNVKVERCPGCGANVDITKSKYCEFCGRELL